MKREMESFKYGSQRIDYEILFVERKTLEIAVHPGATVTVRAPVMATLEKIKSKVEKRARWINKQLDYFSMFEPRTLPKVYLSGETHLYLGRRYRLKITKGSDSGVKLFRGVFQVTCKDQISPEVVKHLLDEWYRLKANEIFNVCIDDNMSKFQKLKIKRPKLRIKKMRKRWGSLSHNGTLNLNIDLIRASRDCINYVIIHELCHIKYHDHSNNFYNLMELLMPDWEKKKHKLELALI